MQHLSGLAHTDDSPRDADGVTSFYRRKGPPWQPEALRLRAGPARAVPGERFQYGDRDTLVLAGLLEHVSGQPLRQLMQQRLAQPLKLRSIRLNEGRTWAMAVAMDASGQPVPQPVMATYGAAGAMEGTARDLLAAALCATGGGAAAPVRQLGKRAGRLVLLRCTSCLRAGFRAKRSRSGRVSARRLSVAKVDFA
jgi:CubicO group peptidase (beta-lactamase class C family)